MNKIYSISYFLCQLDFERLPTKKRETNKLSVARFKNILVFGHRLYFRKFVVNYWKVNNRIQSRSSCEWWRKKK